MLALHKMFFPKDLSLGPYDVFWCEGASLSECVCSSFRFVGLSSGGLVAGAEEVILVPGAAARCPHQVPPLGAPTFFGDALKYHKERDFGRF